MSNTSRPHMAIINIGINVFPLRDTGECDSMIVKSDVLQEKEIPSNFIIGIEGFNLEDCLTKLKTTIQDIKNAKPKD